MTRFLLITGVLVAVILLLGRKRPRGAARTTAAIPSEWGWVKVHLRSASLKALAYAYRDPSAGPSLKILVDLTEDKDESAIRDEARAKDYQASSTFRLGAHETLAVEGLPDDVAKLLRSKYESGECTAGPDAAILLRLTEAERSALALPDHAPGVEAYL